MSNKKQSIFKQKAIHSLVAAEKPEFLDNFNGREGVFIKGFLINDQRNKNGWRTTREANAKYATDFINHPGTYLEIAGEPDHPDGETYLENMSNQEKSRVTNIVAVQWDETKQQWDYIAEILPPELSEIDFKQMLDDGKIDFTSPGIWPEEFEVVGTMENGRPALDVFKYRALHYSYINDPAYGKDTAKIVGTCEGSGVECSMQLTAKLYGQTVPDTTPCDPNAPCPLSNMQKLISQIEDPLAPLIQKPIILKRLKSNFTPCEINDMHASFLADKEDDCVSRKLRIIMDENPNMDKDQQLAIAFSFCQKAISAQLAYDLESKAPIEITSI